MTTGTRRALAGALSLADAAPCRHRPILPATVTITADHPTCCDNCHAPLHGNYCHQCGQHAHNPLKSFTHAVEDVFESFWHLDGRIFRTLRELWIPGRIAGNYLAGQRVRYLPPLRLFVIMSVFAFFVARLSVGKDSDLISINSPASQFAAITETAQVNRHRDALLADMVVPEDANGPAARALAATREAIAQAAQRRIAELEGRVPAAEMPRQISLQIDGSGQPWHPVDNPVDYRYLPDWANAAINHRLQRLHDNVQPGQERWQLLMDRFLAALPAALFVMMPLLALVLRLVYLRRPMGYLEHLVVALYSHAWLLTALLLGSGISALAGLSGVALLGTFASWFSGALWLSVPVYLWVMQRRVYGGRWLPHTLRYLATGSVYGVFVMLATMYAMLASLTS